MLKILGCVYMHLTCGHEYSLRITKIIKTIRLPCCIAFAQKPIINTYTNSPLDRYQWNRERENQSVKLKEHVFVGNL